MKLQTIDPSVQVALDYSSASQGMTIADIISELTLIIKVHRNHKNHKNAFFAVIQLFTTAAIKLLCEKPEEVKGISAFNNKEQVQRLQIVAVKRYLDAWENFYLNKNITQSWDLALRDDKGSLLILQNILLGLNTYINLDMSVAASIAVGEEDLGSINEDFLKIISILNIYLPEVEQTTISPNFLLRFINGNTNPFETKIANFSIERSVNESWQFANDYHTSFNKRLKIIDRDKIICKYGTKINQPKGIFLNGAVAILKLLNGSSSSKQIDELMFHLEKITNINLEALPNLEKKDPNKLFFE